VRNGTGDFYRSSKGNTRYFSFSGATMILFRFTGRTCINTNLKDKDHTQASVDSTPGERD
jgi:hypothetical protein